MRRILRHRPSPALVVACLALTIALGGTSYAAVTLPRNSVGTPQLKRNAVNSAKVKNFSLLRADFKRGQVPAGPRGLQGLQGLKGDKGDKGDTGPAGAPNPNAADSDKLDGLDSTAYARGPSTLKRQVTTDVSLGLHDVLSVPNVGTVQASCGFTDIPFAYKNTSGALQNVVQERAGVYTEFENLANNATTTATAASEPNGVTYHVSAGSPGFGDTTIFIVHANIHAGTAGPCVYQGSMISRVPGVAIGSTSSYKKAPAGQLRIPAGSE